MLARALTTIAGVLILIYGVIAALSPLPFGAPLVFLGLLMIAAANPAARPVIRRMRAKWGWFDTLVRKLSSRAPDRYQDVIRETDPPPPEESAES